MDNGHHTVELKGQRYPVQLPGFAEREDVVVAWQSANGESRRQTWALMAGLGLSVPGLGAPGATAFHATGFDPITYGRQVYNHLLPLGHDREELMTAAVQVIEIVCTTLFPRETEVSTVEGFTEGAGVAPT